MKRLLCKFCKYVSGRTFANPLSWQCPNCGRCSDDGDAK